MAEILIILGSKSDMDFAQEAANELDSFGIGYEMAVSSAHRQPEKTKQIVVEAAQKGCKIIIAMAGYAAALPGFVASICHLPVIGVPLPTSELKGIDAALSILQMPGGVPVGSVGIGSAGAKNAALLAVRILALSDPSLSEKLRRYIENQARG
ncbi:MAG: 5-(carboxyamino)imidazole ribonucleotide mutase [candidate division Zixibacteria bacterium CG_4_9_14_3_um_filter_46_8]|nr:MAG: 5-(carboxyamino)imidazole ribonucleotide mutase [candidate division Zixibacteria bacterium CG_4_9_14_3_um_filter_46_8]